MSTRNLLLILDGIVNLVLGILLLFFPARLIVALGLPEANPLFYVNIFGGVLIGIGAALLLERYHERLHVRGLGIGGAIVINLSGAVVLAYWLVFEDLSLSLTGRLFLWSIAIIVLAVAFAEIITKSWLED